MAAWRSGCNELLPDASTLAVDAVQIGAVLGELIRYSEARFSHCASVAYVDCVRREHRFGCVPQDGLRSLSLLAEQGGEAGERSA